MSTSKTTINRRRLLATSGAAAVALTARSALAQPASPVASPEAVDWREIH